MSPSSLPNNPANLSSPFVVGPGSLTPGQIASVQPVPGQAASAQPIVTPLLETLPMDTPSTEPSTQSSQSQSGQELPVDSAKASSQFIDRRATQPDPAAGERRQFGSSHAGLTPAGRELACAIDQYKLQHHRRYITCDEMLTVIQGLGYSQS